MGLVHIQDLFFIDPETWSKRLFSPSWYLDVSSTYVLYVALFLVSPWLYDVCVFALDRCTRSGRIKDAATQQELNEAGLGGVFYVEYRYAMMLTMVCVVLAFAPAEPVVFGVAALALYVWFYADKWLFCNYFRVPPRYSATGLPALFGTLFRDAICLHVIAAVILTMRPQDVHIIGECGPLGTASGRQIGDALLHSELDVPSQRGARGESVSVRI